MEFSIKFNSTGNLEEDVKGYCDLLQIPEKHFIEVISDLKVIPMIRGKGAEFSVFDKLTEILDKSTWEVKKENLNAQPGSPDEDVSVIHTETGVNIDIEVKTAVRNSFNMGKGSSKKDVPHFRIKCHKSRSYKGKETNDRYLVGDFDIVVANLSNSLIKNGEEFEMRNETDVLDVLTSKYGTSSMEELFKRSSSDWIFAVGEEISEKYKGYDVIPRTPYVDLNNDDNWSTINNIEPKLLEIVKKKST